MNMADWLTYTDIEQLKRMNRYYGCENQNSCSKYDLIRSLLQRMNQKNQLEEQIASLDKHEFRFLQLIMLDPSLQYSMEELLAKGRAALDGEKGEPRRFIVDSLKRGWIFPGYSYRTQSLYHVPSDLRERVSEILLKPFRMKGSYREDPPAVYRDEQEQLLHDLDHFLLFLKKEIVRLTLDGAIYKNQQKQMFQTFYVPEEPVSKKGPRFGFGRCYHLYPDRFSLLYDYAYYKGYFIEDKDGYLCLTEKGSGKLNNQEKQKIDHGKELVRFWIRLYRRAIPQLPMVIRLIALLAYPGWIRTVTVYQATESWLNPFYYETKESVFQKVLKMMVHLGVLKIGREGEEQYISLTPSGVKWLYGISAFRERAIEEGFLQRT
ncbi:hypothetical protein [Thermoactinomyces sp. CICC 23799]|uniref:hypothetical protein n=1 Tax=Thermoactinomyces sp. CICC 23799 TaxID=2767429 RepID=UPI0018DBC0EF|nr:hypothetical protein [Thermoactinomyces sp. CICC 23799]MBH8601299.1 hypothetical protein [Thermoactinomyces sp. CICC 23799]